MSVRFMLVVSRLICVLTFSLGAVDVLRAADDDIYWSDQFFLSGLAIADEGYALTVFNGDLIASGSFEHADGIPAQNVARWNGSNWLAMGGGLDSCAYSLVEYHGELYAGVKRNTDSMNTVVKWAGSTWSKVGDGLYGDTYALAVYNDTLYAAGDYRPYNGGIWGSIVKWDGIEWLPADSGVQLWGSLGWVYALAVYDGSLIAGGEFDSISGVAAKNVAGWDGSGWHPLDGGVGDTAEYSSSRVEALIVHNSSLIAAGGFAVAGGVTVNSIASWDGSAWSALGSGVDSFDDCLGTYAGDLIAPATEFDSLNGRWIRGISRWDGVQWQSLGSGANDDIGALSEFDGELIALGRFCVIDGVVANGVAKWNGSGWTPLASSVGQGFSVYDDGNNISALEVFGTNLIAGGRFASAGSVVSNGIAQWDGINWQTLGSGIADSSYAEVYALVTHGGDLYAGGHFDSADGTLVNNVARWNGVLWAPLGTGVTDSVDSLYYYVYYAAVEALASHGGNLYAGGSFDDAGGTRVNGVARWDGAAWYALGSGISNHWLDEWSYGSGSVESLMPFGDDLIVGGSFDSAGGGYVGSIARWDGVQWYPLAGGIADRSGYEEVQAMAVFNGDLIVTGHFDSAGGVPVNCIARWDGVSWHPLGSGLRWADSIGTLEGKSLDVRNGSLYVGGTFDSAGNVRAKRVARWDGTNWHALGSGVSQKYAQVKALHEYNGSLFVGGDFLSAGGKASALIAEWNGPDSVSCPITLTGDVDLSGNITLSDVIFLVNYVLKAGAEPTPCPAAGDANCDGGVKTSDIIYLVNYVLKAGPPPCDICSLIPGTWSCP